MEVAKETLQGTFCITLHVLYLSLYNGKHFINISSGIDSRSTEVHHVPNVKAEVGSIAKAGLTLRRPYKLHPPPEQNRLILRVNQLSPHRTTDLVEVATIKQADHTDVAAVGVGLHRRDWISKNKSADHQRRSFYQLGIDDSIEDRSFYITCSIFTSTP